MATARRAGGHIDRGDGKGWVLDDTPTPPPPKERPRKPLGGTGPTTVGGWVLVPEPEPVVEPEPEPVAKRPVGRPRKER